MKKGWWLVGAGLLGVACAAPPGPGAMDDGEATAQVAAQALGDGCVPRCAEVVNAGLASCLLGDPPEEGCASLVLDAYLGCVSGCSQE